MKNFTKIICIIDKSGSMESIKENAINGFNDFLNSQKEIKGDAKIDIILFDSSYEKITNNIDIKEVENLSSKTYIPNGSTSLYDSIGVAIDEEIDLLSKLSIENSAAISPAASYFR